MARVDLDTHVDLSQIDLDKQLAMDKIRSKTKGLSEAFLKGFDIDELVKFLKRLE